MPARASSPPSCRQPPSACSLVWRWGAEPRGVNKHLVNSLRLGASLRIATPCSRTAVSSASLKGGRRPALGTCRGWLPSPGHGWVWDRAAQRPGLPAAAAAALRLGRALQGDHSGTCRTAWRASTLPRAAWRGGRAVASARPPAWYCGTPAAVPSGTGPLPRRQRGVCTQSDVSQEPDAETGAQRLREEPQSPWLEVSTVAPPGTASPQVTQTVVLDADGISERSGLRASPAAAASGAG